MRLHLQANGGHTDRIAHALLAIDDVAAGYHVKDLPRVRDGDGARGFDGPHGVAAVHVVPRRARDRDHASRVLGADVASRDADKRRPHFEARDPLGGLDRGHDRLHGPVDIDNDTLAESIRSGLPDPDDVDAATGGHLADESADFRRTDVDGDEHRLLSHDSLRSLQWKYRLQPLFACRDSGKLTDSATALEKMAADDRHVLEDPPAEGKQRHEIEVDPKAVAEECQGRGKQSVGVEARQKDPRVEVSLELGAPRAEQRVERGEDADRRVAGPLDREVESKREAQKHPGDKAEEREQHFRRD